jgi:hypothetical protein
MARCCWTRSAELAAAGFFFAPPPLFMEEVLHVTQREARVHCKAMSSVAIADAQQIPSLRCGMTTRNISAVAINRRDW